MNKIAVKVSKAAEKAVLQGHPWVFENSIIKQNKIGHTGDVAILFDQRKNQFLGLGLLDNESHIRVKILHTGKPTTFDQKWLEAKLEMSYALRKSLLETDTSAFRLVYGENDGFPSLIIDVYNGVGVIKLYSGIWLNYLDWIKNALNNLIPLDCIVVRLNRLLQQQDVAIKDGECVYGSLQDEEVQFKEHGLWFSANVLKGHKTGYFLDHRHNRLGIRDYAKGQHVLDVFSYAGGFTVNALAGGAQSVTSLDISKQALELAKANVKLNFENAKHHTLAKDAFEGIAALQQQQKQFGLIIVDPPSFAKSEDQIAKAKHNYRKLVKSVIPILKSNGVLLMASCSSRVSQNEFYDLVEEEVKKSGRTNKIIKKTDHDIDHPKGINELSYLKSIYFVVE